MPPRNKPPAEDATGVYPDSAPRKRNLLLPILILVTTLAGGGFGLYFLSGKQKAAAIAQVREAGGVVNLTEDAAGTFSTVDLRDTEGDLSGLAKLNNYYPIEKLRLPKSTTDADLVGLTGLKQLVVLSLASSEITDQGLSRLADLESLDSLNLENTQVSDQGLESLRGLSRLVLLDLSHTQVTGAGLQTIAGLTKLEYLDLDHTTVDDTGLGLLKSLESLQELNLDGTQVSDAGLASLTGMTRLRRLSLKGTKVTDAGVAHVQGLPDIEELGLEDTKVSPQLMEKVQSELARTEIQGRFLIEGTASRDLYLGFVGQSQRGLALSGGMTVPAPAGGEVEMEETTAPGVITTYSWKVKVGTYRHHSLPKGAYLVYVRSGSFYDWRWVPVDGLDPHKRLDFQLNGGNAATINVTVPDQDPPSPVTFIPLVMNREGGSNEDVSLSLGIGILPKDGRVSFRVPAGKYRLGLAGASSTVFVRAKETQQVELK